MRAPEPPEVSIVIPVFNEAERIERGLTTVLAFLGHAGFSHEIVVVDDGSRDETADVARRLVGDRGRVLAEPHRGKGGAVRAGMLAARGDYAFFLDIDLATPIEFTSDGLRALRGGADVVIGSRRTAAAAIERHQAAVREFLGRGFSALSRWFTGVCATDFTCGFKGFRAEAARAVFSRQRIANWSFDAEILFIATRLGLRVEELPVRWRDDRRTKVRLGRDIIGSAIGLIAIRWNSLRGRYQLPTQAGAGGTTAK